jgi:membrane-associated protease RseP (regulator of RpoE activity)
MLSAINKGAAHLLAALLGFLSLMIYATSAHPLAILFVFLGPSLAVLVHELGHALAAWRLGMNVREIAVGPLVLRMKPLRLGFGGKILGEDVGGHVLFDEAAGRYLNRGTDALITLAGPLANLLTGAIAYIVGRMVFVDGPTAHLWLGFGFASFAAFALSAWPHKLASGRGNDALELVRILSSARAPKPRANKSKRSPWQAP